MLLNFNLRNVFLFCMFLMLCQAMFGHTLVIASIFIMFYLFYLYKHERLSFVDSVFSLSFLMNVWFITKTVGNVYQYDYFNFYMHADYFVMNDFFIKNPKMYLSSVYFQPPLWGFVAGMVTKLMMLIGQTKEAGFDFVRFISLFAIGGSSIVFWNLIKKFEIKENIALLGFAFYCFFPIHSIFSGLVNNDAMTYFLMITVIYLAYSWYLDNSWHKTSLIALLLFIGGMIKFSVLMVCAGLSVLILYKLMADKKNYKAILGQSFLMGVGALLGFAWGLFLLYYNFPLVPPPQSNAFQDMSAVALSNRLFSLDTILVPFVNIKGGLLENNVWLSLVKTSLFGEWLWDKGVFAYVLYVIGFVFTFIAIISFFSLLKVKLGKDYSFNLFVIVLVFAVIISWIGFWLEFPYFCSTEYRYVAVLLPLSLLWIMNWWQNLSLPKWSNYTLIGLVALLIIAKFMLYLNTI